MAKLTVKKFTSPEETRPFQSHGRVDLITLEGGTVGRGIFEPGWKWSDDVKPIAGTESCEAFHSGYVLSGRMHIVMDDGQEVAVGTRRLHRLPARTRRLDRGRRALRDAGRRRYGGVRAPFAGGWSRSGGAAERTVSSV